MISDSSAPLEVVLFLRNIMPMNIIKAKGIKIVTMLRGLKDNRTSMTGVSKASPGTSID